MIHHIKRATRHFIVWSLLALAISLSLLRVLMLEVDHYQAHLSTRVSELVGADVSIGRLRANMRGYHPEVVLKDIKVLSANATEKPSIQLKEIRLGINLLAALVSSDSLASSKVTLVGAKLTVKRKQDGSIAIVGLKASDEQPVWLLQGGQYDVIQSEISWQDELNPHSPTVMGAVDMAIINKGQQHRLNMKMKLPPEYGDELTLSMVMQGPLFEPAAINGKIYIEARNLVVQKWLAAGLPQAITVNSGHANAKLWGELQQSQLVSLIGDLHLRDIHITRPEQGDYAVKQLASQFFWQQTKGHWRLDVPHFDLETADKKWPVTVFSVAGELTPDQALAKLGVFASTVDLQEACELAHFFAPLTKPVAALLRATKPKGTLAQLSVFADLTAKQYAVNGTFKHLSVAPTATQPGIENLSGFLKGSEQQGQLIFNTQNARVNSAGLFRDALDIKQLNGTLNWRQTAQAWTVSSPKLDINSADISTTSKLVLRLPKKPGEPPFMDMQVAFVMDDMTKVPHYLPTRIMGKNLVNWLDHAFISGRVPKGGFLFYGNLGDFPFTGGQGVFETRFDVEQMELAYNPDWPHLTGTGGEVVFFQDGLQIAIRQGASGQVAIEQAQVAIPVLDKSTQLLVQGKLSTGIRTGLAFMQKSPLHAPVDKSLAAIEPQGDTQVTLDLKLPLVKGAPTQVDGFITLDNARLKVKALDLDVTEINGRLKFNEHGIYSAPIKATALAHPIQITIKGEHLDTDVHVQGRAGVKELRQQFMLPGWQVAEGAADYQIKLHLPSDDRNPELLVQSTLVGVSLDLPGTLAKNHSQQRPLTMVFDLADAKHLPINVNYDNQLKAALLFNTQHLGIESGQVLIGAGAVEKSQQAGITLAINRERLALQDWLGLGSTLLQTKAGTNTQDPQGITDITVHTAHGLWKNTDLGAVDVHIKPEGRFWTGDISGSLAKGKFKVPHDLNGADSISLTLDSLDLTVLKGVKAQSDTPKPTLEATLAPEVMPLISMTCQKMLWQSVDLGALNLQTGRIVNGIVFNKLELTGGDVNLSMTGAWQVKGEHSQTHAQGDLAIAKAGQLLTRLGVTKNITDTRAKIDFAGDWAGAPYQFSLADWQGDVNVNLKDGRILGIEPGFGRVLGILAVAQWIKRLQLDFSDVYQEGLTFNVIQGLLKVAKGRAVTDNLTIDAIPAKITLIGVTDLLKKTVDYRVSVVPKSADAVPIAGTIMGKMADLIGQSLTGKDQQGFFFGSEYRVKGDWGNAQVIPLHENDGILQKTWHGITGFPWLQHNQEP